MSEPIRILQHVRVLDSGGIEAFIFANLRKMNRNKVNFDFLVTRDQHEFYDDELDKLGCKKIVLNYKRYNNSILNPISQAIAFYKFCKENKNKYPIIHFQSIGANGFLDIIAAKMAGIPCRIAHSHIANDIKPQHNTKSEKIGKLRKIIVLARQSIIRKLVTKFSTHYFGCSKMACEWMFTKKINESGKSIVVKNPIDVQKFRFDREIRNKIRKDLNIEDKFVIGHVGRFVFSKNHDFLLEVFARIRKQNENVVLVLVGGGKLENEIIEKIKQLDIESSVILYGETKDVNYMYSAFDLFMFPSLYEGLGIVLVEAQANGLSVMGSNTIPEEVKLTKNFYFCDINNVDDWVNIFNNNRKNLIRNNENYNDIIKSGYDISDVATFLENTYLKLRESVN